MEAIKTERGKRLHLPKKHHRLNDLTVPACGRGVNNIYRMDNNSKWIFVNGEVDCPNCLRLEEYKNLFLNRTLYSKATTHPLRQSASGQVYLIKSLDYNVFKIGYSKNLNKRFSEIQSCSPVPLILVHSVYFSNASEVEKALHETFKEYRLHNEWFKLPEKAVAWFCSWGGK